MKKIYLAVSMCAVFAACNDKRDYDISSDKNYEKSKETIEEKEQKNPTAFLQVSGTDKKNLLGQTVVKGTVTNSAKMVTFKDVEMLLSFYSKTGALLEQDHETVYEKINPGASKSFKSKFFTPKGTDSVAMKILSAKY